jgi:hypothetical protein
MWPMALQKFTLGEWTFPLGLRLLVSRAEKTPDSFRPSFVPLVPLRQLLRRTVHPRTPTITVPLIGLSLECKPAVLNAVLNAGHPGSVQSSLQGTLMG